MSRITLLRAADRRAQPWKNGGGVTREVAVFPAGADMAMFDWRISIAEVTEAGPFSCFEGVDRVLTVLGGELALSFDAGGDPVHLTQASAPFSFAADTPVHGAPRGGPVRDLNVMVRRGAVSAKVERAALLPDCRRRLGLSASCVLDAHGNVAVQVGDQSHDLTHEDALLVEDAGCTEVFVLAQDGALIFITLTANG